jgi:hypothetical protein
MGVALERAVMTEDFFGEDLHARLTALFEQAVRKRDASVAKARAERPELAGKTDAEIAEILSTEDHLKRKRRQGL